MDAARRVVPSACCCHLPSHTHTHIHSHALTYMKAAVEQPAVDASSSSLAHACMAASLQHLDSGAREEAPMRRVQAPCGAHQRTSPTQPTHSGPPHKMASPTNGKRGKASTTNRHNNRGCKQAKAGDQPKTCLLPHTHKHTHTHPSLHWHPALASEMASSGPLAPIPGYDVRICWSAHSPEW